MKYWYPDLDGFKLGFCRFGGPGLGNHLFPWARCVVYSHVYGGIVIPPIWRQIKLGPIVRNENDFRWYWNIFKKNKVVCPRFLDVNLSLGIGNYYRWDEISSLSADEKVILVKGMAGLFDKLHGHSQLITESLLKITNLKVIESIKNDVHESISIHVRLGDFKLPDLAATMRGDANTRISIDWYVKALKKVREDLGNKNIKAYVFTDGSNQEIRPLLSMVNVERYPSKTALGDILAMSKSKAIIASGSTFSMWSVFLGQKLTYWHEGQSKGRLVENGEEYELLDTGCGFESRKI